MQHNWPEFFQFTKARPPSPLLVRALEYVAHTGRAVDIGGGALKDTRHLLAQGFDVTVIDGEPVVAELAKEIKSPKLHVFVGTYESFAFQGGVYDLANASYALPFNPPETFDDVFVRIKDSLVVGGVFCGQLFGTRDEWAQREDMTFHTSEKIETLMAGMQVLSLEEFELDRNTATGRLKHWHYFEIIAKKI